MNLLKKCLLSWSDCSAKEITVIDHLTIIISFFCILCILGWIIVVNKIAMIFVPATALTRAPIIASLILLIALHTLVACRTRRAARSLINPIAITSIVWRLRGIVLTSWLVQQLIWILVVIILHRLLHLFFKRLLEPLFCWLLLVCLINFVLMLILDMSHKRLNGLKLLRALR